MKSAAEVARELADALEADHLSYAIGGALALAYYAPPRATVDVDLNVFVGVPSGVPAALAALRKAGFSATDDDLHQTETDGQFRGKVDALRVDVFVPAVAYYGELETRRRQVILLGRPVWIVGAEDLAVLEKMFFRRKDLADVEAMLRHQGGLLSELMGSDDPRLSEFAAIARDVDG